MDLFNKCQLCPRKCLANRHVVAGACGAKDKLIVGRAALHHWEEPIISGNKGSGTIFFSHCPLKCVYCQNITISQENIGEVIDIERFSDICLELEKKQALNINLVTPTHFVPLIIEGIKLAKKKGLTIPIVYNTSGYETKETISLLKDTVDIYLTDFKYYDNDIALKYSNCPDYFTYASLALQEMFRQVPHVVIDDGIMKKGIIVRHLVLPNLTDDSKRIIKYLYDTYQDQIFLSIMNQYTPLPHVAKYPEINRVLTKEEYDEVVNYAIEIGVENGFLQDGETAQESFIPVFDGYGVKKS